MKEFIKVLVCAVVGTFVMLAIAVYVASLLRTFDREIVSCITISIVGLAMLTPLFYMMVEDSTKEDGWILNAALICMGYIPIQAILIAAFL